MEPTTSRLDRLTTETKDLSMHVAALDRRDPRTDRATRT